MDGIGVMKGVINFVILIPFFLQNKRTWHLLPFIISKQCHFIYCKILSWMDHNKNGESSTTVKTAAAVIPIKGDVRPYFTFKDKNENISWTGLILPKTDQNCYQKINKRPRDHITHLSNSSHNSDQISIAIYNSKWLDNLVEEILLKKILKSSCFYMYHIFLC